MADGYDYFGSPTMGQPGPSGQFDWARKLPYSYQSGSSFGGAAQSQQSPVPLYSPNQQAPTPAPTAAVPQSYNFGPEDQADPTGESKNFAQGLGQGVLAASQGAARQSAMQMGQKRQNPYGSINQGGGWNVGGMSGMDYT